MPDGQEKPDLTPTFGPGELLGPTVASDAKTASPAADASELPIVDRGNYAVEGEFARGGMGRILSARDRRLSRVVALKELQATTAPDARRFVREALVTARLQHPAIVPIYEAGRWPDGVPFYAMKLVSGRSLDALIRGAEGGLSGRLALLPHLLAVAEAVAFAHSQRIVHRDLKPANVLVGGFGETVVVDWGLAKDLSAVTSDDTDPEPRVGTAGGQDETVVGSVLGTPAFMPPEQARGEPVDERADVFALGAMLYYLLAGTPPRSGTTVREVLAAAANEQQPVPVAEREPETPPDLAAIVRKAMDPAPARRYPTARELAEDLRRFQTGQLVSAHRYSPGELLRRWVRQHRAVVTVAAVLGLALVTAIVGGFLAVRRQAKIAEGERDRARTAAAEAEQVNAFLRGMLASADPYAGGKEVTVASVLDRASQRLSELGGQPEVKASLELTLGQTYKGLGLLDPAEAHARAALEGLLRLHGEDHADVAHARELVASVLLDRGDLEKAEASYREAIASFDRLGQGDGEWALSARSDLAATLQNLGRFDEAEALDRDLLERQRRVFGHESDDVANTLNNLGVVLGQRGNWPEAEALHREALEIIRRVKGPRNPEVASALSAVANAVESRGDLAGAEELYREALTMRREILGSEHPETAHSVYDLAYLLRTRGEDKEAEALCREVLALRGRVLPDTHPMVAAVLQVLGLSLVDQGRAREAEPLLRESLALRRKSLPAGHWLIASSESVLGGCLTSLGRYREAETLLVRAHDTLASTLGGEHERTLDASKKLVALYEAWGKPRQADPYRVAVSPARH
jgi:tetratricopeptide (TPR) repeat protein